MRALQGEYFAEDIELPADASSWTEPEARSFFESGGENRPILGAALSDILLEPVGCGRFSGRPSVFETNDGCRIIYHLSRGQKTPVVLLGGGSSGRDEACRCYGAESELLREHTVLIFDRRNTGASDVSYTSQGNTPFCEITAQACDLAELLAHLQLPPAILLGHSSGARLLCRFAFAYPARVRALVLCILTGGKKAAKEIPRQYYLKYAGLAERGGMEAVLSHPYFAERGRLNGRVARTLRGMEPAVFASACRSSAHLLQVSKYEPALGLPHTALASLSAPTLVLSYLPSPGDGMHTAEVARAVAAAIPTAGEALVSQDPTEWHSAVACFIAEHST